LGPCLAEEKEKDTKWLPISVKNAYGKIDIRKRNVDI